MKGSSGYNDCSRRQSPAQATNDPVETHVTARLSRALSFRSRFQLARDGVCSFYDETAIPNEFKEGAKSEDSDMPDYDAVTRPGISELGGGANFGVRGLPS